MQTDINNFNHNIHYEIRNSVIILIAKIVWVELIIALSHILLNQVILWHGFHDMALGNFSGQIWELLIFHAVTTCAILYFVLQRVTTYYTITDREIVHETGIISRKRKSYDLPWIQEIDYIQWFRWRICSFGDIVLENPLISWKIYIKTVPRPDYYARLIKILRDNSVQNNWHEKIIPIKREI